jgi:hypothetical protein
VRFGAFANLRELSPRQHQSNTGGHHCGCGDVYKAIKDNVNADAFTTGHNHSKGVMAHAVWFKANGFDDLPLAA